MSITNFAKEVDLTLCQFFDSLPLHKANQDKSPLYFLKGDPSEYNNPDFQVHPDAYSIMKKHLQVPTNHGYTLSSGVVPARQAILKLYHPKINITPNDVVIQHGVNQGLLCVIMAFTNPGDEILVPETGYPIFQKLGPALRVNVKKYKLKEPRFEIDLESVKAAMSPKTQFIFIINPMNPTGTIFSLSHMKQILNFCDENQLPIVVDQVYHGQNFPEHEYHSFGDVTEDVPVIVLNGMDKLFMTPGWCTSWSVIFDKHKYLETVWRNILTCGMIFLHSNKPTQMALPELIEKGLYLNSENIKKVQEIESFLFEQLSKIQCFQPLRSQGTIYQTVLINVEKFKDIKDDKQFVQKLLIEENVALLPLSWMGGQRNGLRMLTCGLKPIYEQLLVRLKNFYENHKTNA